MFQIFLFLFGGKIRIGNCEPDHHPEIEEYSVVIEDEIRQPLEKKGENSREKCYTYQLFSDARTVLQIGEAARCEEEHEYDEEYQGEDAHFRRKLEIETVAVIGNFRTADGICGIDRGECLLTDSDAGDKIVAYQPE